MPEPHPFYFYGPYGFIAISCVASMLVSPWLLGVVQRRRRARHKRRDQDAPWEAGGRTWRLRIACIFGSIALLWLAGTAAGWALLRLPVSEPPGRLPGDHVDAAMIAHAVPTTALAAADHLIARLEEGAAEGRWRRADEVERRLVLAGRVDPHPDRAVTRLLARDFRTRAGLFALANPSPVACAAGLDALAEALRGGSLQELMAVCRNAPGDPIGEAAFKMGDFLRAVGSETESIISRQARAPRDEPECLPGGFEEPDASMPLCRLVHTEAEPTSRRAILGGLELPPGLPTRWRAAALAGLGEPLDPRVTYTIDPVLLVERPLAAVIDEPIAVYAELRTSTRATLLPGEAAWVRLAQAASRSAFGRHGDAALLVDEALRELDVGDGATDEERAKAARLAAAIALRAGEGGAFVDELGPDDPLRAYAASRPPIDPGRAWTAQLDEGGAEIAARLAGDPSVRRGGLLRLAYLDEAARAPVASWLREGFPSCAGCAFFDRADQLAVRLDGARAVGDAELVADLEPVVARFEAVFLNRLLALSLRTAAPEPLLE